jgi:hypothetical protein
MRNIAIVGAGQAGTLLAAGLQRSGYQVALFSDRPPERMLNEIPPTGTAAIFGEAVEIERRLGVETYEDRFLPMNGIHLFFEPKVGTELLYFGGPLEEGSGAAVDVRLKSYDRMLQVAREGGEIVVEEVTPKRLDEIAGAFDLTFVSTGKGGLADLFARHPERSVYERPQRRLAMVVVHGIPTSQGAFPHRLSNLTPVCFNFFGDAGEMFWVPYYHKTAGQCWNLVFEAKDGCPFDSFRGCRSLEQAFGIAREVVQQFTPWDWEVMRDMEPVPNDPLAWLVGAFPPTIREPIGVTESGHLVMSLGDTSMAYDPIGGQGAGSGTRQAGHYFDAIVAHEDRPFDGQWMSETFESFFGWFGEGTYRFNNVLLEPLDAVGVRIMKACFASPSASTAFMKTFNHPPDYFPWLKDRAEADGWIGRMTGQAPSKIVRQGTLRILKGRLAQKLSGRHFPYAVADTRVSQHQQNCESSRTS